MAIQIKVKADELKSSANKITTEINNIQKEWNNIASIIKKTKGYWEGDASQVHQQRYSGSISDVQKMIKDLKDRPDELLKMAGLYETTEQETTAEANSLPSDVFA